MSKMKIKYSKSDLEKIIWSVRAAEGSDDLPIHNWARAAKVLDAVATSRLELLRDAKDAIKHGYYSKTLLERIDEALGDEN